MPTSAGSWSYRALGAFVAFLLIVSGRGEALEPGSIGEIPYPGRETATGMAWNGSSLLVPYGTCDLFRLDPDTGAVLGTVNAPACMNRGVVYDGAGHYFLSNLSAFVTEIDENGVLLDTLPLPFRGNAIAFDGTHLYVSDFDGGRILVMDREGNVIRSFESGARPAGMVYDPARGTLWVMDALVREITVDGVLLRTCSLPRGYPTALTMVEGKLYMATSDTIYIVDPRHLTCDVPVFVDTTPPVLVAPPDVTVECLSGAGQAVDLGDAAATDESEPVLVTNDAPALFPPGTTLVTWTATDAVGLRSTATQRVTVVDTTPPSLAVEGVPSFLWPPNHRLVRLSPTVATSDACDPAPTVTVQVLSDEPDEGLGDGDTAGDVVVHASADIELRAERSGAGDGRLYTLVWTATDAHGNARTATIHVTVPKSR